MPGLFVNSNPAHEHSVEGAPHAERSSHSRNASFLSRSAILGDDFPDIDHTHGEKADVERKSISPTTMKVLTLYEAFDLPPLPLRQSLVEAFMERCYTFM